MGDAKPGQLERWLARVGDAVPGLPVRYLYEDRERDRLVASVDIPSRGLLEVIVHRAGRGAHLLLIAESAEGVSHFAGALGQAHRAIRRRHNADRRFVHRVENMANHLAATFDARHESFPHNRLSALQQTASDAVAMVGVEARFRVKSFEEDAIQQDDSSWSKELQREAKRYRTRFGARVMSDAGPRAALFSPERGTFRLGDIDDAEATLELLEIGADHQIDAAAFALDAASEVSWTWGGLDVPDCDCVDVPDCGSCG